MCSMSPQHFCGIHARMQAKVCMCILLFISTECGTMNVYSSWVAQVSIQSRFSHSTLRQEVHVSAPFLYTISKTMGLIN